MAEAAIGARPRKLCLANDETLRAGVERAVGFCLAEITGHQVTAAAGEVEPIHQFRVAARRLRAAIDLFTREIHANNARRLRRDLAWAAAQAGSVRECDTIQQNIRNRAPKIEPGLAKALEPIHGAIGFRRAQEQQKLAALLESKRYQAMLSGLGKPAFRKIAPDATIGITADSHLRPIIRATLRAGAGLTLESPPDAFHRLRVRIKRLRYVLEMLPDAGVKRQRKMASRLEDLQDLFGAYNDVTVTIGFLRTYAASDSASRDTVLACGAMLQSLATRQQKLARRCIKAQRRFERLLHESLDAIRSHAKVRTPRTTTARAPAVEMPPEGQAITESAA